LDKDFCQGQSKPAQTHNGEIIFISLTARLIPSSRPLYIEAPGRIDLNIQNKASYYAAARHSSYR